MAGFIGPQNRPNNHKILSIEVENPVERNQLGGTRCITIMRKAMASTAASLIQKIYKHRGGSQVQIISIATLEELSRLPLLIKLCHSWIFPSHLHLLRPIMRKGKIFRLSFITTVAKMLTPRLFTVPRKGKLTNMMRTPR